MIGLTFKSFGRYIPEHKINNHDFENIIETSDEWITKRTGIKERHVSDGEFTWQMALKAAQEAIENAQIDPLSIDMILVTTVTSDFFYPSISNILQGKLKADHAFGIDISCACAGFIYGIDMLQKYIASDPTIQTALIVSAENITKTVNYDDRSSCILFGDAAGAAIVTAGGGNVYSYLAAEGKSAHEIYSYTVKPNNIFANAEKKSAYQKEFPGGENHYLYMNGREVYKFATRVMPFAITNACEKAHIKVSDLDWIIPHQANLRIIETSAKHLHYPMEKMYTNIEHFGNTSSASIPICLYEMEKKHLLKKGQKIGLVGFGAGLVYGACVLEI